MDYERTRYVARTIKIRVFKMRLHDFLKRQNSTIPESKFENTGVLKLLLSFTCLDLLWIAASRARYSEVALACPSKRHSFFRCPLF